MGSQQKNEEPWWSRHGGDVQHLKAHHGGNILDFSANLNPLGAPNWLPELLQSELSNLEHYPDPNAVQMKNAIADFYGVDQSRIVLGNGSSELIHRLPSVVKAQRVVLCDPCYLGYGHAALGEELPSLRVPPRDEMHLDLAALEAQLQAGDLVFLGYPVNPTAELVDREKLVSLVEKHPEVHFAIDEAFLDFAADERSLMILGLKNLTVLRSLTKFYAMAGLRMGFAVSSPMLMDRWRSKLPEWNVSTLGQAFTCRALADREYQQKSAAELPKWREELRESLSSLPRLWLGSSKVNYLFAKLDPEQMELDTFCQRLLREYGVAIRHLGNIEGLSKGCFRIAVRRPEENRVLIRAMESLLSPKASKVRKGECTSRKKTPALMLQGTSSNAGKTLLCAALCRILKQDGVDVAPFKSQNMSLNSFVTTSGAEISRAQVLQAQACRLAPEAAMNPVLIKPNSMVGSQIIVRGKVVGNMSVAEYHAYKEKLWPEVCGIYDELASQHQAIILEGAGSPGEINLKQHDIVNMKMAEHANSPVYVVGDIDRGGVFASFIGTDMSLHTWERRLLKGFIVNRFRGEANLLQPAFDEVLARTGKPVLGPIPFVEDLNLPDEDSVSFKEAFGHGSGDAAIKMAVIDLPHISNFSDLDALKSEPDLLLIHARKVSDLEDVDVVIIPGSKNTMADMRFLQQQGYASALKRFAIEQKLEIVGVCAGLQILGKEIRDDQGIEGHVSSMEGLGFLNLSTALAEQKTLRQTIGHCELRSAPVRGYEVHHGETVGQAKVIMRSQAGEPLGYATDDAMVWGTYLHGVFDDDDFRHRWLEVVRERKGLGSKPKNVYDIELGLEHLAAKVRPCLPMDQIYASMGL